MAQGKLPTPELLQRDDANEAEKKLINIILLPNRFKKFCWFNISTNDNSKRTIANTNKFRGDGLKVTR